ncbi:hypothetical protein ILUMI_25359 [Ignelater luminosus]|uniref:Uncharacterized protein n=1 Tax=Ignelater luminosus TaxID=2038154 RepID=A0A8K0C8N9_IGNLU|nr:hypothetical protein ILUMI_25359 [Ignelater luminosus]
MPKRSINGFDVQIPGHFNTDEALPSLTDCVYCHVFTNEKNEGTRNTSENIRTAVDLEKLGLKCPTKWNEAKLAGQKWLEDFMPRSPNLSLRTSESTSLGWVTFNKANVTLFGFGLEDLMRRKQFPSENMYNLDETKRIGQATSAKCDQLITMSNIINAVGNIIRLAYFFARVKFVDYMLHGTLVGSLELAHKCGWMAAEDFVLVMKHFIKHNDFLMSSVTDRPCQENYVPAQTNFPNPSTVGSTTNPSVIY